MYTDLWFCEWNDWLDTVSTNPAETPVYAYYFNYEGTLSLQHNHFVKYLGKRRGSVKTRKQIPKIYFSNYLTDDIFEYINYTLVIIHRSLPR